MPMRTDDLAYMDSADGFLGIPEDQAIPAELAAAVVVPFGLEATVTFGRGTGDGPAALLRASHEVELYDREQDTEPALVWGVATLAPVPIPRGVERALALVEALVEPVVASGRVPAVVGGEHSVTAGAIRPAVRRAPELVLLHFDAHADLRDGYEGVHYSHASAIRRCLDHPGVSVVSFGVRNISREGMRFARAHPDRVAIAWAADRHRWDLDALLSRVEGKPVWITVDVDVFDASLMPATGTPEPGGLAWDDVIRVLEAASRRWERVVGVDLVELAPIQGFHAPDFVAASLLYRTLCLALGRAGSSSG